MMKKTKILICLPIIVFIIIWGIALAKCEILTLLHGDVFSDPDLYAENTSIGDMEYIKVLNFSDDRAEIYYVSENHSLGCIISFVKKDDIWQYYKWEDTLWSADGNADKVIFPYWWHIFYTM